MIYPDTFGVVMIKVFTEQQILITYLKHWSNHMQAINKQMEITLENCIKDFTCSNQMYQSDQQGNPIIKPAKPVGTVVMYDVQDKGFDGDTSQWISRGRTFSEEQSAVNFCTALKSGNATGKDYRVVKVTSGIDLV